jgi:hypothetical protein
MKSAEQIKQSFRKLNVEAASTRREQTLRDIVAAHTRRKQNPPAFRRRTLGRIIMTHRTRRIAAMVALAVLIAGALGLGTGSVAFSQAGHAVNSTLAWLRQAVVGSRPGEPRIEPPVLPAAASDADEQTPNASRKAVSYAARFFRVAESEASLWQSLKDQGIELVKASTNPEVYYATLTRAQGEAFDASINASINLRRLSSPNLTVADGEMVTLSLTDSHPPQGLVGFALGLVPAVSSDGTEVQSTISFHDGRNGFEVPNVSTESGGLILIRAKGIFSGWDNSSEPDGSGPKEDLIRIQVDVQ